MKKYTFDDNSVFMIPTICVKIEEHSFRVYFMWLKYALCWEYKDEEETDNNGNGE